MAKFYATALLVFSALVYCNAQPGTPDAAFNSNGYVITDFYQHTDFAYSIKTLPNGDIVVGGDADSTGIRYAAVVRLNPDGTYDTQLASTGRRALPFIGGSAELWGIDPQPDGRIIGAGSGNNLGKAVIFRMNPNGSLDGGFAQNGFYEHLTAGNDVEFLNAVKVQPDGKIVAVGTTGIVNDRNVIVFRLKTDGTPDSTFGSDGIVIVNMGVPGDFATDVVVQADGKTVVVGGSDDNVFIFRLLPNGGMDNTFDGDGRLTIDRGYSDDAFNVALQTDNKIVVSGRTYNGRDAAFVLRLNTDGSLDNAFGQNGIVDTAIAGNAGFYGLAIQPDGKIICGGRTFSNGGNSPLVVRLNSDGTFDNTFATGGIFNNLITPSPDDEDIDAICLLADGRLATTGSVHKNNDYSMLTVVYLTGINTGLLNFNNGPGLTMVYPNPVKTSFKLEFKLQEETAISTTLIDLSGREIASLTNNKTYTSGAHTEEFNLPANIAAGQYLVVLQTPKGNRSIHIFINQ